MSNVEIMTKWMNVNNRTATLVQEVQKMALYCNAAYKTQSIMILQYQQARLYRDIGCVCIFSVNT